MQIGMMAAAVAAVLFTSLPAAAGSLEQTASSADLPSAVLWLAGIAGFIGFLVGSVPANDPDRGWKFDLSGALVWAVAAASATGGVALVVTTASWTPGLYAAGLGLTLAVMRLLATRPPRVPRGADLTTGINRAAGDTPKARLKAAERLYNAASFHRGDYYATRSPRDFRYGGAGAPSADLALLAEGLAAAYPDTFDILVLLLRELPGEAGQPAVIVVRGAENLRKIVVDKDAITVPDCPGKIPAKAIAGMVGYAWR